MHNKTFERYATFRFIPWHRVYYQLKCRLNLVGNIYMKQNTVVDINKSKNSFHFTFVSNLVHKSRKLNKSSSNYIFIASTSIHVEPTLRSHFNYIVFRLETIHLHNWRSVFVLHAHIQFSFICIEVQPSVYSSLP